MGRDSIKIPCCVSLGAEIFISSSCECVFTFTPSDSSHFPVLNVHLVCTLLHGSPDLPNKHKHTHTYDYSISLKLVQIAWNMSCSIFVDCSLQQCSFSHTAHLPSTMKVVHYILSVLKLYISVLWRTDWNWSHYYPSKLLSQSPIHERIILFLTLFLAWFI